MTRTARNARRTSRPPARLEKFEQRDGVELLTKLGAKVYVLGTHRPRGKKCPKCGTFVAEHQGTCQTPGIADIIAFLPNGGITTRRLLVWEVKRSKNAKYREAQFEFLQLCSDANVYNILGDLNALLAWLIEYGYVKADNIPAYRRPQPKEREPLWDV